MSLLTVGGLLLAGCVANYVERSSTDELLKLVVQPDQADRGRLALMDELLARPLNPQQRDLLGRQLARVVASSAHSPAVRRNAATIIADRYRADAPLWLSEALVDTQQAELAELLVTLLVELNDGRALPNMLLAMAGQSQALEQTSPRVDLAVEQIAGRALPEVLKEQLLNDASARVHVALLNIMCYRLGPETAAATLLELPPDNQFVEETQFWARRFDYVPTNGLRYLACKWQRQSLSPQQLDLLQRRVKMLHQRHGYRFDIHDSYLLLEADESVLGWAAGRLTVQIQQRLRQLAHTKRPASYPGAVDDYSENFAYQRNRLGYTDLLRISLLMTAFSDAGVAGQLRDVFAGDLSNIGSEAGGLCFLENKRVTLRAYTPGRRAGDNRYVESAQMVADGVFCLARWHCHVDPWRAFELAGPGVDDLHYADYVNCPSVVITCLDSSGLADSTGRRQSTRPRLFNADYFTPGGGVVDLGNYPY